MLPNKDELEKMMKESVKVKEEKNAREREASKLRKEKKDKEDKDKFDAEVKKCIELIEEDILHAIKNGRRSRDWRFGDGFKPNPVWEKAVSRLKRKAPAYNFELKAISVWCNNHGAAANVDGVTAREWSEDVWELMVTW